MKNKIIQIIIAYVYHAFFIVQAFLMMQHYPDSVLITFAVIGILYLIYWIAMNRKGYMPWSVYLHFLVGAAINVLLNYTGIIPEDSGFFSGLGQFFFIIFLLIDAALLGVVNLILWLIDKLIRQKK